MTARKLKVFYFVASLLIVGLTVTLLSFFATIDQEGVYTRGRTQYIAPEPQLPELGKPTQFGVYLNSEANSDRIESELDGLVDIVGWFESWGHEKVSENKLRSSCQNGQIPLITWESWGGPERPDDYPLEEINAGLHDAKIYHFLAEVNTICKGQPMIIRLNHELEMRPSYGAAWYPWQGQPEEYVKSWQRIVTMSHQINPDIKWLWSPNRADEYTIEYYPGDEYVDYVGLTLNHPPDHTAYAPSFKEFYGSNKRYLEAYNKPIIIGETAFDYPDEARKVKWVQDIFRYMHDDPNITAFVWFNQQFDHLDYRVESSPATLEAFRTSLKDFRGGYRE